MMNSVDRWVNAQHPRKRDLVKFKNLVKKGKRDLVKNQIKVTIRQETKSFKF